VIDFCYSNFKIKKAMNNVDGRNELSTTLKQLGLLNLRRVLPWGFMKQNIRKVKLGIAHLSLEHFSNDLQSLT
jgi:hypothetical protein